MKYQLLDGNLKDWIPKDLIIKYYNQFYNQDALSSAQAMNVLLVLAKFNQLNASALRQAQGKLGSV